MDTSTFVTKTKVKEDKNDAMMKAAMALEKINNKVDQDLQEEIQDKVMPYVDLRNIG